jgi:hypothetical protein
MPRYFFDVLNDTSQMTDEEGIELSGMEDVRRHALDTIGSILHDEISKCKSPIHLAILVNAEDGSRIASFRSTTSIVASEDPFREGERGAADGNGSAR